MTSYSVSRVDDPELPPSNRPVHLDITAPTVVQIEVSHRGDVMWVNIDGLCALRVCRFGGTVEIIDNRPTKEVEDAKPD